MKTPRHPPAPDSHKIHPPIVNGIVKAVSQIFNNRHYSDKVLERLFKQNRKWGARDRRLVAETVYAIVRHWRRYLAELGLVWSDELWFSHLQNADGSLLYDDELLRRVVELALAPATVHAPSAPRAERESITDWYDALGESQLGDRWESVLSSMNRLAPVYLRVNRLRTTPERLAQRLADEGIQTQMVDSVPSALVLERRQNVFTTAAFKEGWFEVQDAASQQVAPLLQVEPGQRVIDACAGAGGKTLHLAEIMANRGRLIALDIHAWKLEELRQRARRAGVSNIECRVIDSTKVIKRLESSGDAVLLDVPCSGSGVLRRNPDSKWRYEARERERLLSLQRDLFHQYSALVRPGGHLVYATCSVFPEENEAQVRAFLSSRSGSGWELVQEWRSWPDLLPPFDGFYAAFLRRPVADGR